MAGVYVSYPFCSQKCSFCNFASDVGTASGKKFYLTALCREIREHRWTWTPETLYLGGGTPSLLDADSLRQILEGIPRAALNEATLECAPGTVNPELTKAWRRLGINRVSLGVQSFFEQELKPMGRRHTTEIVFSDVAILRDAGITNFNVDLIAGLPYQTEQSWEQSLDCVARLEAPHVSVYLFEKDEESRLGRELLGGGWRYGAGSIPSEEAAAELYERACDRLCSLGCARYEISNFARAGFESMHNLKYWQREPYAGFGLDAHSFDGVHRWGNPAELNGYLAAIDEGRTPEREAADGEEEHFFVGLRLDCGIQPTSSERKRFTEPIRKWRDEGFLLDDGLTLRLSREGVLLSNEILQDFIHA